MPVLAPQPMGPISGGSSGPWVSQLGQMGGQSNYEKLPAWQRQVFERMHRAGLFFDSLIPPPLYEKARALATAAEFVGTGADLNDASQNYRAMFESLKNGDVPKAISDFGWGLLSNLGASEIGKTAKTLATSAPVYAVFPGMMARTADHDKLRKAGEMAEAGANARAIWNDTGWFKGADDKGGFNKWRYEIPDNPMRISPHVWRHIRAPNFTEWRGALDELLEHSELFEAYPDLRGLDTTIRYNGDVRRIQGEYGSPSPGFSPYIAIDMSRPFSQHRLKQGIAHEGTHHIQFLEDFAPGGDLESGRGSWKIRQLNARKEQLYALENELLQRAQSRAFSPENIKKDAALLDSVRANILKNEYDLQAAEYEFYHRLRGEVEARNVVRRLDFMPTQRLAMPPWTTERMRRHLQTFVHR